MQECLARGPSASFSFSLLSLPSLSAHFLATFKPFQKAFFSLDDYFHSANFEYFESGTYSLRTIAEEDEEELSREREEEENRKRENARMERKHSSEG